jgi:hypothetical protein
MKRQPALLLVLILAASLTASAAGHTKGRAIQPFTPELKPGDYVWRPQISPAGPVVVIVSLPEQEMYVYRNGVRIGRSTVSTGKKGHDLLVQFGHLALAQLVAAPHMTSEDLGAA